MTVRFSVFSHLENLHSGSLEFGNPFEVGRHQPLVCRYELARQSDQVLAPDPSFSGLAQYHQLLPVDRHTVFPPHSMPHWEESQGTSLISRPHSILRIPAEQAFVLPCALAAQHGVHRVWCRGDQPSDRALIPLAQAANLTPRLSLPESFAPNNVSNTNSVAAMVFEDRACPSDDFQADFGTWANPYRVEGLKCLGLEAFHRMPDDRPALLYFDPHGELSYSLVLAAELIAQRVPNQLPFRPIAVQTQNRDFLCRAFETGGNLPDQIEDPQPPAKFIQTAVRGMMALGGTCIRLNEPDPNNHDERAYLLAEAHTRLARTLFVEEEDSLVLLLPK